MASKVALLGAGKMGQAFFSLLQKNHVDVSMWDVDCSKIPDAKPLAETVSGADFVCLCMPSWCIRSAVESLLSLLDHKTILISISKGIEKDTGFFIHEIFSDLLPKKQSYALISGPMLAEELQNDQGGVGVCASPSEDVCEKVRLLFDPTSLRLRTSTDIESVELAGVLKNIYAIALGIAEGLGWQKNRVGWLCGKAIEEMCLVATRLGKDEKVMLSPAGVGDFIATSFSEHSSNRSFGQSVAQGNIDKKGEGVVAFVSLEKKLGKYQPEEFPVVYALSKILNENAPAKEVFEYLFFAHA